MKRTLTLTLLLAILLVLPGAALGAEEAREASGAIEVMSPGFTYHTLGTEAAQLVQTADGDYARVAGELFILEEGYLSIGYEKIDDHTIGIFPEGAALTCLNRDLTVRWVLDDQRLSGAWYTNLVELDGALLLGIDRVTPESRAAGGAQVPSLMLVDKADGAIRWQTEGITSEVWIADYIQAADGNILVASNGALLGETGGEGTLSLLDAGNGQVLWSVDYQQEYGLTSLWEVCQLGDGLLLYGKRAADEIVLYTDSQGVVRGWFAFAPWEDGGGITSLRLRALDQEVAYLWGWEMEMESDRTAEMPYNARTLCLMRLTPASFLTEKWY